MADEPRDGSDALGVPPPPQLAPPPVGWEQPVPPVRREVVPGLVFASTPRRFVAYLIDGLIAGVAAYLFSLLVIDVTGSRADSLIATWSTTIASLAFSFVYFVWGWRTRARATPGMRLLKLQVGNAADGRTLGTGQAIRRWFALGEALSLLYVIPELSLVASVVVFVYGLILLITTIVSPTKQGLHDRFARTMVVQPAGLGSSGLVVGCIALAIIFLILPFLLILLGGQLPDLLSAVGSPAP